MFKQIVTEALILLITAGVAYYTKKYLPQLEGTNRQEESRIPVRPNRLCPECMRQIQVPFEILPCMHLIHTDCLRKWLKPKGETDPKHVATYF